MWVLQWVFKLSPFSQWCIHSSWDASRCLVHSLTFTGLVQGRTLSLPLLFLPFLPVNQTGIKRRLISPLSGWQCLGDRPVVANWMVLCPLSCCINPCHISFPWTPLSSPLSFPQPFINSSLSFSQNSLSPSLPFHVCTSPSPGPVLSFPDPSPLFPLCSPCFSLFSFEQCRATRGISLVRCSQVNWLAQRKGPRKKKWIRRTPSLSREKRESTCVFLTLAALLNSDAAAVRPDVILSHWLVLQSL